ncbi:MAG TPA: DUF1501 domain-containing protein [Pirellulales bacterium]|nr:DUF1501 domain-containing protein [Pirellulales bacterium]
MRAFQCGCLTRRHFLASGSMGIGSVALAWLLNEECLLAAPARPELGPRHFDLNPKQPHHPARARSMISLFMQGGPSHLDLLDPKSELTRLDGGNFTGEIKYDNAGEASAKLLASPWKFAKHGQCGTEVSELLPHLAEIVDDVTVIRSMHTGVNNHNLSIRALQTGRIPAGRPSLGSWLLHGLGSESQNLPAFVVLEDPAGLPVEGIHNWSNGWLPSLYQGTVVRHREPRILDLDPPPHLQGGIQDDYRNYLQTLNHRHLESHPGELDLEARIASFELAARMQLTAKEALDIGGEPAWVQKMYGLDEPATRDFGSRCLLARRLVERGVRFVQLFKSNWDHHNNLLLGLPASCQAVDRPVAALVKDLRARGLLETTIVHWGGEMGRLPVVQNLANPGRDHNTYGFSMWLAGGGIRGGVVYGETDDFGYQAVKNIVTHNDYHATLLHLFGLDYQRLLYLRNGREESLLDNQPCRIVREVLS